jgi:hypothetical protein
LGIYAGIDIYEKMYADYVSELKANFQDEEWLASNSYWQDGNVYMYDGVPYYADLLADCTIFEIDSKTYELWQGNKVGNIPSPVDAWSDFQNFGVTIGQKFMDSVKAFADNHILNNNYFTKIPDISNHSVFNFGSLYNNQYTRLYSNNGSIVKNTYTIRNATDYKACVCIFTDIAKTYLIKKNGGVIYVNNSGISIGSSGSYGGYYLYEFNATNMSVSPTWEGISVFHANCASNSLNGAKFFIDFMTSNPDLFTDNQCHIYINPNVSPCVIGGNHYNLGDIKGVNDGIVGAIGQAIDNGTLNPNIDPSTLPNILPGIIPTPPLINPLPIVDPKPYIPSPSDPDAPSVPDEPTEPDTPIDPINSDSWENINLKDMTTLFPFCIPFDILEGLKLLKAEPKNPIWEIPIKIDYANTTLIDYTLVIDLTSYDFNRIWNVLRTTEVLCFCIGLGLVTKKFIY